jgi:hypothetical protein
MVDTVASTLIVFEVINATYRINTTVNASLTVLRA